MICWDAELNHKKRKTNVYDLVSVPCNILKRRCRVSGISDILFVTRMPGNCWSHETFTATRDWGLRHQQIVKTHQNCYVEEKKIFRCDSVWRKCPRISKRKKPTSGEERISAGISEILVDTHSSTLRPKEQWLHWWWQTSRNAILGHMPPWNDPPASVLIQSKRVRVVQPCDQ